jgi:hypothetical protein
MLAFALRTKSFRCACKHGLGEVKKYSVSVDLVGQSQWLGSMLLNSKSKEPTTIPMDSHVLPYDAASQSSPRR